MARKRRSCIHDSYRKLSRVMVVYRGRAYKIGRRLRDAKLIESQGIIRKHLHYTVIGYMFLEGGMEKVYDSFREEEKILQWLKDHPEYPDKTDAKIRNKLRDH